MGFLDPNGQGPVTALGAINNAAAVPLAGYAGCGLSLAAGTLVGTLTPEWSVDGAKWEASQFIDATGTLTATIVFGSANVARNLSIVCPGGAQFIRVRVSAYTSGTANAFLVATPGELQIPGSGGGGGGGGSVTQGTVPWVVDGSGVTQPVSAASLPLPAGAATQTTLAAISGQLASSLPLPTGAATQTTLAAIAAQLPTTLGAKTTANSLAVNLASDQTATVQGGKTNNNAVPGATNIGALGALANAADPSFTEGNEVLQSVDLAGYTRVRQIRSATATITAVASSATSVTILAANAARKGGKIWNNSTSRLVTADSTSAVVLTTNASTPIAAQGYYEIPFGYTGAIQGIWDSVNGQALATEFT